MASSFVRIVDASVKMFNPRSAVNKLALAYSCRSVFDVEGYKLANISSSIMATQLLKEIPASPMRESVAVDTNPAHLVPPACSKVLRMLDSSSIVCCTYCSWLRISSDCKATNNSLSPAISFLCAFPPDFFSGWNACIVSCRSLAAPSIPAKQYTHSTDKAIASHFIL
uniref:Uncharacterized protein n=1 Tax=Anopheles albimanus TaxID=7167 RepID=A0A1I8JSK4_ANOAL